MAFWKYFSVFNCRIFFTVVTLLLISFSEGRNDHHFWKKCCQRERDSLQRRLFLDAAKSCCLSFVASTLSKLCRYNAALPLSCFKEHLLRGAVWNLISEHFDWNFELAFQLLWFKILLSKFVKLFRFCVVDLLVKKMKTNSSLVAAVTLLSLKWHY